MIFFKNSQYILTKAKVEFPSGCDMSTTSNVVRTNLPFSSKHITHLGKITGGAGNSDYCRISSPSNSNVAISIDDNSEIYEFVVYFIDGLSIEQAFTSYETANEMRQSIIDNVE